MQKHWNWKKLKLRNNFQSKWIFRCILQRSSLPGWSSAVVEAQKTYWLPVVDPTREDCLARYRCTAPLCWATRYPGSFLHGRHDRLQDALGQNSGSQRPNRWNPNSYTIYSVKVAAEIHVSNIYRVLVDYFISMVIASTCTCNYIKHLFLLMLCFLFVLTLLNMKYICILIIILWEGDGSAKWFSAFQNGDDVLGNVYWVTVGVFYNISVVYVRSPNCLAAICCSAGSRNIIVNHL